MTKARFVGNPPNGSGFTESFNQSHYDQLVRGETPDPFVAIVVMRPVGITQKQTADGTHRSVLYDFDHAEPGRRDRGHDVDRARLMLEEWGQGRHTPQQKLPLDFGQRPDEDQRLWLLEQILAWCEDTDVDPTDLWWDTHSKDHTPPLREASATLLRGFAIERGILSTEEAETAGAVEDETDALIPEFAEPVTS